MCYAPSLSGVLLAPENAVRCVSVIGRNPLRPMNHCRADALWPGDSESPPTSTIFATASCIQRASLADATFVLQAIHCARAESYELPPGLSAEIGHPPHVRHDQRDIERCRTGRVLVLSFNLSLRPLSHRGLHEDSCSTHSTAHHAKIHPTIFVGRNRSRERHATTGDRRTSTP